MSCVNPRMLRMFNASGSTTLPRGADPYDMTPAAIAHFSSMVGMGASYGARWLTRKELTFELRDEASYQETFSWQLYQW